MLDGTQAGPDAKPRSDDALRVLKIGSGWYKETPGGSETMFYELSRHLSRLGLVVDGLAPCISAASDDPERVVSVLPAGRLMPRRLWRVRVAVASAVARSPPALVATHFALYAFPCLDLIARYPMVVHFHGPWADESAAEGDRRFSVLAKAAIERCVYRRARRLIVLSQRFGELLQERYGVPAGRIRIVPGGVDCARFASDAPRRAARARLGWPEDRPTILAVRRLVRRMGLPELIAAMGDVRRYAPDVRLVIAGRGPEQAALQSEIDRLGLRDTVHLAGFVAEDLLPLAYRAADVTVVPSTTLEGFCLAAIESLASGTPVLVTPVGGLPETVRGLADGLVLPGGTAADIASGLTGALIGSLDLPHEAACRAYARSRFDWDVIARRTRDVYVGALRS
jgi:glycosyltransferase involved in cell wall biosynthesis